MKPKEKARKDIDNLLSTAGWTVQNRDEINLGASLGVAVR
jgi:type I restriction enzyme R subunit